MIPQMRLFNQHIAHAPNKSAADVVSHMLAMQGQDYRGGLWAIGLRMKTATEAAVEKAVRERAIVRTWPMRGTLHFIAAADVRWMLKLLTTKVISGSKSRQDYHKLDAAMFGRCEKILAKQMQGGKEFTREQITEALEKNGIEMNPQRCYHIVWRLAQEGVLCYAGQSTFALLEEWIAPAKTLSRDESLAKLATRFFASHGPATIDDLARWAGISKGDAKSAIALAGKKIGALDVDGETFYGPPAAEKVSSSTSLHLLPGFDEYVLGYKNRDHFLDPKHAAKIVPGANGVFKPTIVLDGRIVGTWQRKIAGNKATIVPAPFGKFKRDQIEAIEAIFRRYQAFIG
jgi:hypothetical protein